MVDPVELVNDLIVKLIMDRAHAQSYEEKAKIQEAIQFMERVLQVLAVDNLIQSWRDYGPVE